MSGTRDAATAGSGPQALTAMQIGLLAESLLGNRSGINVEQVISHLDEDVSVPDMQEAWRLVQDRHPVLRSRFVWTDTGEIRRETVEGRYEPLVVEPSPQDLESWLGSDRADSFDLHGGPVMRMRLLAASPERSVLVWTFHHALLDGRSFSIVLRELLDVYDALGRGDPVPPPVPRPSFDDHVEAAHATDAQSARDHYRSVFEGYEGTPAAPPRSTRVHPASEDRTGAERTSAEVIRTVPRRLVDALEARSNAAGGTLGTALLATWAVLVSRWTNSDDVVFGSTRSGRHLVANADSIVGCLITASVLRARIQAVDTVDDLIGTLRAQQISGRPHEHLALTDVHALTELGPETPLLATNVMFEIGSFDSRIRDGRDGWSDRRFELREATSFPMSLAAYLDDDLELRIEHRCDSYEPEVVAKIADHLVCLIESVARSTTETRIDDLRMFTPASRKRLLVDRNPTRPDVASTSEATFMQRFASQATTVPDRIAIRDLGGDSTITYGELHRRAAGLAAHLVALGCQPDRPIGICIHRSIDFMTALIAINKVGAPYLPLDPTYPVDTLTHMVTDSGTDLVVTVSNLAELVVDLHAEPVTIDELDLIDQPNRHEPLAGGSADDPAYVIYTSGSTGSPKGVVVSRRAVANHLDSVEIEMDLTSGDRVLQFSSLSFDVSLEEILPTLALGAELVLRSDSMARSIGDLIDAVNDHRLTVLNLPSAFWHVLVDHLEHTGERLPPSVRLVVVGGEKVSRHAYATWARIEPDLRLLNAYGPTEATITCTTFDPAGRHDPTSDDELPIGHPLPHARAYVLGLDGRWLMPDGQEGELWIGGQGVAIGYLGQPALTSERFRPDPYSPEVGARMYRTGDRARWRRDGELEYLGRIDRQVKVRGFRIEPQEIESLLERSDSVKHAHVAMRTAASGASQLVAWVVGRDDESIIDVDELVATVRSSLPAHKVPDVVVVVDKLPLTPGGKVDVAALPTPLDGGPAPVIDAEERELTASERQVARHMAAVLVCDEQIGVDESFFEMGGNSVLAVRLIGRLEHETGIRVPYGSLHRSPTVGGLAAVIAELGGSGDDPEAFHHLTPIQPQGSRPPLYAIHVLGTNECYYRPLSERLGDDQPVFGLSVAAPSRDTPTAVAEVASLYVEEIVRHHPTGMLSLAAVSMGAYVAYEVAQQLRRQNREVSALVLFDAAGPAGRPQLPWPRRVLVHLELLARSPRRRVTELTEHGMEAARGFAAAARLRRDRRRGLTPDPSTWMHGFVAANARAVALYDVEPYDGPILAMRASDERFDTPEWTASALGWSEVAAGGIDVFDVPGQHLTMLQEPHVAALAAILDDRLPPAPGV